MAVYRIADGDRRGSARLHCRRIARHAFEALGCNRVEFKTDVLNERSRAALARIGAREEGILRRHMVTDSGRVRESNYFSIIAEEWPEVRAKLEARLRAGAGSPIAT